MSDIFREVDEALQKEKVAKMWKEYGPTILMAAIVLVVATGAGTAYRSWTTQKNQTETSKLILAVEDKDSAASLERAASKAPDDLKAVALMNAASRHADQKDFAKAGELYGQIADDKSVPSDLRDLAAIYYTRATLLAAGDKAPDYKALAARLAPIAKNEKAAFKLQARLDAALLYGDGLKDYTKALGLLTGFDGDSTTDSLKEKASALQHVYQYELSQSALAKTPTPATPSK